MAHGWVKSLQCKSRAFHDVHDPKPNPNSRRAAPPGSSSCRSGSQALKDVIGAAGHKPRKHKYTSGMPPVSKPAKKSPKLDPPVAVPVRTPSGLPYPALTELPEGHPSRGVVEIIFNTSWGPKAFSGRVEMIFKVQNGPRAAARFEEYREEVRSFAGLGFGGADARCVADGNEMMRFQCVGPMPTGGAAHDYPFAYGSLQQGKVAAICTFSGSGQAHESAGRGRGRSAMLVCRVIAGRVSKRIGVDPFSESQVRFDSLTGKNGELLVYDSRAVLPCFLIIYRL